jgi:hypothetical protein
MSSGVPLARIGILPIPILRENPDRLSMWIGGALGVSHLSLGGTLYCSMRDFPSRMLDFVKKFRRLPAISQGNTLLLEAGSARFWEETVGFVNKSS